MTWDAYLKSSKIVIDLMSDSQMMDMVEHGLRGGISMADNNYARANNKYFNDFDRLKPSNYIQDWNCMNLYGFSMCMPLPLRNFEMHDLSQFDLQQLTQNIMGIGSNDSHRRIFEVDLDYPDHLHDLHNDYPLAV